MKIICPTPSDFSDQILIKLKKNFKCNFKEIKQNKLNRIIKDYDVVLTRFNREIVFKNPNNLKYILTPTTGTNHIDKRYFKSKTKIISLFGELKFLKNINASAEFSIYLILKALKTFRLFNNKLSNEINGKFIGIVGYGRIGKKICPILEKMGAKIYIYDVKKSIVPRKKYKTLKQLLKASDILSFHIPLNSENKNIIGKNVINHLKENMIIINTSRGEIFDERQLFKKIIKSNIFYATDVLGKYFLNNLKNEKIKNKVIYTGHVAGLTNESVKMTDEFILKKFLKDIKN